MVTELYSLLLQSSHVNHRRSVVYGTYLITLEYHLSGLLSPSFLEFENHGVPMSLREHSVTRLMVCILKVLCDFSALTISFPDHPVHIPVTPVVQCPAKQHVILPSLGMEALTQVI